VAEGSLQGSYDHEKLGKVMEFLNDYFQAWKSPRNKLDSKSFGKVIEMFYIHMIVYAEFEIITLIILAAQEFCGHSISRSGKRPG